MSEQEYRELQPGDIIQEGDQWQNECGRWRPFLVLDGSRVQVRQSQRVRRPIGTTHQATYEEVPGSRTTQETIIDPQRERIAYEELRPGTEVQAGDQYRNTQGRWVEYSMNTAGVPIVGPTAMARRPHKITALEKYRGDLIDDIQHVMGERHEVRKDRDLARAEVARLSTELWARKPLEDRVASLTEELAQARAELQRLQEVVNNLYSEPTARQVQQMLRTWATELDWSAGCFDSVGRDEIDTIQKTLVAVIERIESIINAEGGINDN